MTEPRRAVLEQVAVALVGLLRACVAGVLAMRPQLLAVHLAVDAARVRVLARFAEAAGQVRGNVALGIERLDLDPGVREPPRIVGADDRGDRAVVVSGGHLCVKGYPRGFDGDGLAVETVASRRPETVASLADRSETVLTLTAAPTALTLPASDSGKISSLQREVHAVEPQRSLGEGSPALAR